MKLDTRSLSRRAGALVAGQSMPEYLIRHFEGSRDPYHPTMNPEGYIGLCVAENKLVADLVSDRLNEVLGVPPSVLGYDAMTGSVRFRERLGRFMGRTFLDRVFEPEQISVLAGAGSVLEILFHILGDRGDGVLVPTPSYAGFWMDLELRNRLTITDRNFLSPTSKEPRPSSPEPRPPGSRTCPILVYRGVISSIAGTSTPELRPSRLLGPRSACYAHTSPGSAPGRTRGAPRSAAAFHLGGPRASSVCLRSRCLRIASTTSCSMMNAITIISEPHEGHNNGSTS
jgi:hypothetical protein